jgi:hypothetical protein
MGKSALKKNEQEQADRLFQGKPLGIRESVSLGPNNSRWEREVKAIVPRVFWRRRATSAGNGFCENREMHCRNRTFSVIIRYSDTVCLRYRTAPLCILLCFKNCSLLFDGIAFSRGRSRSPPDALFHAGCVSGRVSPSGRTLIWG